MSKFPGILIHQHHGYPVFPLKPTTQPTTVRALPFLTRGLMSRDIRQQMVYHFRNRSLMQATNLLLGIRRINPSGRHYEQDRRSSGPTLRNLVALHPIY